MPHYYFHLYNDVVTHDAEGAELDDIQAARAYAIGDARRMAAESIIEEGHLILSHRIEIAEEEAVVEVVEFRDAIEIRG